MAKKVSKGKSNTVKTAEFTNIDIKIEKYFWLVIPLLALVYYISSLYSKGFYQDDEVAQYLNMLQFWVDPKVILGNNPKPGYKIFMVLPALVNFNAVLIVNSLFASLAVFFTFKLIRLYNINFAFLAALFLGVQPLFFDLSFRSYSEIFTSLLIVLFLISYKKELFILSGLLAGYIFTVRQEIAIFLIILFVIFLYRKKYSSALAIAVFPLIYDFLGFIKTGDILFIVTEMRSVASLNYASQGIFHYFKFYIFIVGPVSLLLFLYGFFGFLKDTKNFKKYFSGYHLQYLLFVLVFIIQMLTMINDGPNPGNWRYLLHISPVCAFFAVVGFNNLRDVNFKGVFYSVSLILILLTLLFLSKVSDGFKFTEPVKEDYTKVIILIVLSAVSAYFIFDSARKNFNSLAIIYLATAVIYLAVDFKPKQLSSENVTVKNAAEYLNKLDVKDKSIYTNHAVLMFFSEDYRKNPSRFKTINSKNLNEIQSGSLVVWEDHYGFRPDFKDANNVANDVQLEVLQKDSTYKLLNQVNSSDPRRQFRVFFFEKK